MKSFAEALAEKRTLQLAEQTFNLMVEAGIDPESFVVWLEEEGRHHADLNKSAQLWLENSPYTPNSWYSKALTGAGGLLGKAAGWAGGAPVRFAADTARGVAHGAMAGAHQAGMQLGRAADLAKNKTGIQPASKMFCKTGFYDVQSGQCTTQDGQPVDHQGNPLPQQQPQAQPQQNVQQASQPNPKVQNALKSLQNLSRYVKDQNVNMMLQNMISQLHGMLMAPPAATPVSPPQQTEAIYNPYLSILETRFFDRKLERLCATLAHRGVNPVKFVEWYVTEGQYFEGEELNENFGDWFGRNFHGFTQAVSGLGDGKGFWNRWQQGSDGFMQDQTKKATDAAIKALKDLQSDPTFQDPNFKQNIEQIMSKLSNTPETAPQTQTPDELPTEDPQNSPADTPQEPAAPSGGMENDSTGPAVAPAGDMTPPTQPAPDVSAPVDPANVAPPQQSQPQQQVQQPEPSQQDIQTAAYYYKQNNPNASDEEAWNMGRQQLMQAGSKAEWFKSLPPGGKRLVEEIEFHQSLRNMSKRSWLI